MSAPFLLGKVIDTIYTSGADAEAMTASLTSLCIMLTGVFLCGGAANAARVYLMQASGEPRRGFNTLRGHPKNRSCSNKRSGSLTFPASANRHTLMSAAERELQESASVSLMESLHISVKNTLKV